MNRKGPDEFKAVAPDIDITLGYDAEEIDIALLNVKAHPLAYELQKALAEVLDMDEIYIKGGAVRNMISGHEVDEIDAFFDIRLSPLMDEDNMEPDEMLAYAARLINSHEDFEDCQIRFQGNINGEPSINIIGQFKGIEIDLHPVVHDLDVWTCAYDLCNTSILSSCMDPNGECWARSDFMDHLQAGLLIPDEDQEQYGIERLEYNVERKYGPKYGWSYVHPSQRHLYEAQLLEARRARENEHNEL